MPELSIDPQEITAQWLRDAYGSQIAMQEWRPLRDYIRSLVHAVEAAASKRERERLAARLKIEAETVKHTSHADGLGMGWQALEQRLLEIAAAIREKPSEKVFNTASQFMEHYGAGEQEEP